MFLSGNTLTFGNVAAYNTGSHRMKTDLQELAAAALGVLPQAAVIVDGKGGVLLRNAAADAMLPAGKRIGELLVDGEGRPVLYWRVELSSLADSAGRATHRGVSLVGRGGRQVLADIHLRVLPKRFGRRRRQLGAVQAVLVLVEDVSGRVSMERQLAADERLAAMGQLAAKVAHELNNPLDGVLRYIGLAERAEKPQAAKHLSKARSGLMRMADIVRGLMEQGREGRSVGQKTPAEKLLDEAVSVMQPRAQALGVAVVCDLAGGQSPVSSNLFQVFCNVIKNALDAMPNGGVLTVRMRAFEGNLVVEFADTGVGLTEQEAQKVFEPFYTTKAPGEGAGLGLCICREIVTRLGGTIQAAPRKEGGAVITIKLPLSEQGASACE